MENITGSFYNHFMKPHIPLNLNRVSIVILVFFVMVFNCYAAGNSGADFQIRLNQMLECNDLLNLATHQSSAKTQSFSEDSNGSKPLFIAYQWGATEKRETVNPKVAILTYDPTTKKVKKFVINLNQIANPKQPVDSVNRGQGIYKITLPDGQVQKLTVTVNQAGSFQLESRDANKDDANSFTGVDLNLKSPDAKKLEEMGVKEMGMGEGESIRELRYLAKRLNGDPLNKDDAKDDANRTRGLVEALKKNKYANAKLVESIMNTCADLEDKDALLECYSKECYPTRRAAGDARVLCSNNAAEYDNPVYKKSLYTCIDTDVKTKYPAQRKECLNKITGGALKLALETAQAQLETDAEYTKALSVQARTPTTRKAPVPPSRRHGVRRDSSTGTTTR